MTRFVPVCVAAFVGLGAAAAVARADIGMLPGGATITWSRLFIVEDGESKEPSEPDAQRRYFNLAHCECSRAKTGTETEFQYELTLSAETNAGRPIDLWVGTRCEDDMVIDMNCRKLSSINDIDNLFPTEDIKLSTYDVINGIDTGACQQRSGDATAWLLADLDGDTVYDFSSTKNVGTSTEITSIDTEPPPLPTEFAAGPGEGAIEISWKPPEGREKDIYAYQALCTTLEDQPAKTGDLPDPLYQTTSTVCGLPQTFALAAMDIRNDGESTPVTAAPEAFKTLDGAFLCGEVIGTTATKLTISGLENGTPYKVALLVTDLSSNVNGVYFTTTITPKPVIDFWEDLNSRDGLIDGGCLMAETYGGGSSLTQLLRGFRDETLAKTGFGRWLIDVYYATLGKLGPVVHGSLVLRILAAIVLAPLVVLALLWYALTLPGLLVVLALPWLWRRRRRLLQSRLLRPAVTAAVLACVLAPRLASADDFTPYWEDPNNDDSTLQEAGDVKWHVGIRVGPYIPDIDLQVGENALNGYGPYAAMFGDYVIDGMIYERKVYQIMPVLDVERVLWSGFGQVAVGGSIGYMQKTAYAYLDGTTEDQYLRPRSRASKNTFRLLPLAATASYRFTYLDDRWGIPVVPYLKGGLSYYAWWLTAPSGDTAKVCEGEMCDTARGGSLGFQGSIGLALRAERIDADAAMSMRNSGIQHAGFYAELFWAKVDGFGSESRLSVGDTTWFAGVDFEF